MSQSNSSPEEEEGYRSQSSSISKEDEQENSFYSDLNEYPVYFFISFFLGDTANT